MANEKNKQNQEHPQAANSPAEIERILTEAIESTDWGEYWSSVADQVEVEVSEYAKARTRSYEKNIQHAVV